MNLGGLKLFSPSKYPYRTKSQEENREKDRLFDKKVFILAGLLGFCSFFIYAIKLAPTVYIGDSGDLLLASVTLGVPHPPGYPLYTLIGHLFTLLPLGPSVTWKVNLMSAFFEAATVSIVFLIIYLLTRRLVIAFFGASILAFSYTFWFYGEFAEVFPLNNFLLSLTLLFALLFNRRRKVYFLYLLSFAFGLSVTHHQTSILFLPIIFSLLWQAKKQILNAKTFILSILFFFLPFLFYLYPLFSHLANPPIIWGEPQNFFDLVRLFTRADYGSFQSYRGVLESPQSRFLQIILYWRFFNLDFSILGLGLLILGFVSLFLSSRTFALGLFISFILLGPLFLVYANFPLRGTFEIFVVERFILFSFILAAIVMSYGLLAFSMGVATLLGTYFRSKKIYLAFTKIIPTTFLIFPILLLVTNFLKIDLSQNYRGKILVEDIFSSVEKNAIVFLASDTIVFNSWYLHFAEGLRPDVKLLTRNLPVDWYYKRTLPRNYPELSYPQGKLGIELVRGFIKANIESYAVYQYFPSVNIEGFVWVPEGFLHRLYPQNRIPSTAEVKARNDEIWAKYRIPKTTSGYKDLLTDSSIELYSDSQVLLGDYFFSKKEYKEAINAYSSALSINPNSKEAHVNLGFSYLLLWECEKALGEFSSAFANDEYSPRAEEGMFLVYKDCLGDEKRANEFAEKKRREREKIFNVPTLEKF